MLVEAIIQNFLMSVDFQEVEECFLVKRHRRGRKEKKS